MYTRYAPHVSSRVKAINLPLVITMLCWGFNFVSMKLVYKQVPPDAVALVRWIPMWICLAVWAKWRFGRIWVDKDDLLRCLFVGFLSMGLYMALFLHGLKGTTPSEAAILLATVPILTPIIAVLFRQEKANGWAMVGAVVAFSGVGLLMSGGDQKLHGSLIANVMVLASAVVWALSTAIARPLLGKYPAGLVLTSSLPGALPLLLVMGTRAALEVNWGGLETYVWWNLAQVVFASGVVAFLMYYLGIAQIGPSAATMYQFVVPPLSSLFAYAVFGTILAPLQWVGFAVVLAGVAFGSYCRAVGTPFSSAPRGA